MTGENKTIAEVFAELDAYDDDDEKSRAFEAATRQSKFSHPTHKIQSLCDFNDIWKYAADFKCNYYAVYMYRSKLAKRAYETRGNRDPKKRPKRRSYFDDRALFLHMATLDEMVREGFRGYADKDGKIRINRFSAPSQAR